MWVEPSGWIATGVGAPVVAVFLVWASLVFHCGRRQWRPLDPLLLALLIESVVQQGGACLHTVVALFRPDEEVWCTGLVWWLAAVRTMQAGTLATLAAGKLIRVRYSHLIYHLACLAMLSACIGVAAVLARSSPCGHYSDRRYVVFWLALHISLAITSLFAIILSCCRPNPAPDSRHSCFVNNGHHQRRHLLNSSSDLSSAMSDISMISTMRSRSGRGISHSVSDCSARNVGRARHTLVEELLRITPANSGQNPPITFLNGAPEVPKLVPNSSFLKSKNCRQHCGQCSAHEHQQENQLPCAAILEDTKLIPGCDLDAGSYGVSTLHNIEPCYISTSTSASSTNSRSPCLARESQEDVHLGTISAVVGLCYLINHLPVLCLTVAESFVPHLIPSEWSIVSIPLWAALVEGCLLPVVLAMTDKVFVRRVAAIYSRRRTSDMVKPPQGLHGKFRPFNNSLLEPHRPMETVRFPITNGSLFTSLDGRIPIIHNYRRGKGVRTMGCLQPYCFNAVPTPRFCHPAYQQPNPTPQDSGSQLRANLISADVNCDRKSDSQLNLFTENSKTAESERVAQCFTQRLSTADLRQEPKPFPQNIQQLRESLFIENRDSDDDFEEFDSTGVSEEPIYATLSTRSVCSATTAANDDFEFFQQEPNKMDVNNLLKPSTYNKDNVSSSPVRRRVSRCSSADRLTPETEPEENQSEEEHQQRPVYRQQPPPSRRPRMAQSVRPLSKRLGLPPTPPPPRRLAPVLSVDSLVAALHQADVSYLDTGDLYRHSERSGSVPDLKKVFYTGFL